MKKSLIALAFGTLGLGIAEFVMMGIFPMWQKIWVLAFLRQDISFLPMH